MKSIKDLLDSLLKEALPKCPKVLGYDTLGMLRDGGVDGFAEDLGRSMPFLDDGIDESLLDDKRIVSG